MEHTTQIDANQITFTEVQSLIEEERERQINEIHKDLLIIHQIFDELSAIVKHQGEQIEQINNQTERSNEQSRRGLNEITEAARLQRKSYCVIQ